MGNEGGRHIKKLNSKLPLVLLSCAFLGPLVVALAFHPLWISSTKGLGTVALITTVLNWFITPIYLIIITHFAAKNYLSLGLSVIISMISLYGSQYLQFWNWGTATGLLRNPDVATLMIVLIGVVVSSILLAIGMLTLFFINSKRKWNV